MNCIYDIETIDMPDGCSCNMSGVQRLLFIPKKHVESINAIPSAMATSYEDHVTIGNPSLSQKAITVKSGKEFAELYCAEDLGELKYSLQGQRGSRSLLARLEVFHPSFKKKVLGFFGTGINEEFIIIALMLNGEWHLLGNSRRGAKMSDGSEATSGKAVTDPNGLTVVFEWTCRLPQVFFEGWDPNNETNGVEMFRTAYVLGTSDGKAILTSSGNLIEIKFFNQ